MKRHLFIIAIVLLFCATGCRKDRTCGVPYGDGAIIDLSMPEMTPLGTVGGNLTINRGHKGIFVIRTSFYGDFLAFECACPFDNDIAVEPTEGFTGLLQCPKCKSIFNANSSGEPLEGSQTPCSLYQYSTLMDNDGYHLHIY
ncbi:MAG: hypothetical protein IJR13_09580 [Bacteroidales bacterium]|nr:hypothetical protein [Bacteroidales bacterium]